MHRDKVHPGLHLPIVDRALFDAVQLRLAEHTPKRRARTVRVMSAPLKGFLHDALGRPMTPSFTRASGRERINRYYVSAPVQQGLRGASTENVVTRVPGGIVEDFVLAKLRRVCRHGGPDAGWAELKSALRRVEVSSDSVRMEIVAACVIRDGCDPRRSWSWPPGASWATPASA